MLFMDSTFSLTISVHFASFRRWLFYRYTRSNLVHTFHYNDKMPLVMPQNWVHLDWMDLAVPLWPTLLIIILYATSCLAFLNAAKLSYPVTVLPVKGHEGPEGEQKYCFTLSLTSTLDGGAWSMPHHSHLNPNRELQYSLNRRLGGLQGQSGWVQKIAPPIRIQSLDRPACSELAPPIYT
jgi:hypothetical protein